MKVRKLGIRTVALTSLSCLLLDASCAMDGSTDEGADAGTFDIADKASSGDGSGGQCAVVGEGGTGNLSCPSGQVIGSVTFASYGTPTGSCPGFSTSSCNASASRSKVESLCLNKQSCGVGATNATFGDPCSGTPKKLAVVFTCKSVGAAGPCAQVGEGSTASLSCPSGQVIGSITFASYGTPGGSCPSFSTGSCNAATSKSKVESLCLNKQSCSVGANNSVFGDPCSGTPKKLAVASTCKSVGSGGECAQAGEGGTASLSCPSGQVIKAISFASYGTPSGTCPSFVKGSCHSSSSQSQVESQCLNKQTCSVGANNSVFGDPCSGTSKKLVAAYTCGTGSTGGGSLTQSGLEYYGTNVPSYMSVPSNYTRVDTNVLFQGGLDGLGHAATAAQGAGKFVFNRIYRASKHGVGYGEQYGIFHWWMSSYGNNSIEGGLWVNPYVAGPHYYPTLHIAGVGYPYHTCSDVQFGSGMGSAFLGDRWLGEIQISNRVLTVPGVNVAFDKDQSPYESDNGVWLGWGWTDLNLDHPRGFKYWMSFVETYDYQGPVNGYMPEYFNWVDPKDIANGSYNSRRQSTNPFGTFATLGSSPNGGVANEQYTRGLHLRDDIYYVPVPKVPSYKSREYVIANVQSIAQQTMEDYSRAIKANTTVSSFISSQFLPFNGVSSSTHSQLKIHEQVSGKEILTVVRPPYSIGYDTYNGFIEWPAGSPWKTDQNGYQYSRKSTEKWPLEPGSNYNPNIYKSSFISPPDATLRVPKIESKYFSYKERNTSHPDFANWNVNGKTRYTVKLQNGSTATYVWFKFIEQPAVKTAKQNWPSVYTDAYLQKLQAYIENFHRVIAERSKVGPKDPVFINYRNTKDAQHFEPHLVKLDPTQMVKPPAGFEVGYVPVIISVVYPPEYSANGTGLENAPSDTCLNSKWTRTYFPDNL